MDKKIKQKLEHILGLLLPVLLIGCDYPPKEEDYYYADLGDRSVGRIEHVFEDGNFVMRTLIYPSVVDIKEYDDYILAYQVVEIGDDFDMLYDLKALDGSKEDSIRIHRNDSIYQHINMLRKMKDCYWIIQKSSEKIYGPLSEKEYNHLCSSLDVTKKIKTSKHIKLYRIGR